MTVVLDTTKSAAQAQSAPPAVVCVNGTRIAHDAIVREMQHHPADKAATAWHNAARALVIRELLLQRAHYLGLHSEPVSDVEGRRETNEEALIRALFEREIAVPEPDAESCRRYYDRNQARFRAPDIYEAAHILFAAAADQRVAYDKARCEAQRVLAFLREQPGSFAELARVYSRCPSAQQGGNLGQITGGQTTAEFEQALVALTPGEFCAEPIATPYGFHIIRLDRKHDGEALPYETVASRIAGYLRESVQRRAEAQYVARLVSAAHIEGIELVGAEALRVH